MKNLSSCSRPRVYWLLPPPFIEAATASRKSFVSSFEMSKTRMRVSAISSPSCWAKVRKECRMVSNGKIFCYCMPLDWLVDEGELPEDEKREQARQYARFRKSSKK